MTANELKAIRERYERATPGPWRPWEKVEGTGCQWVEQLPDGSICIETLNGVGALGQAVAAIPRSEYDAVFIAHSRDDIPRLLDALERAQAVVEAARELRRKPMNTNPAWVAPLDAALDAYDNPTP